MKKALVLFLAIAMLLAVLAACASEEPMESAGEVSDFSSEKHFDINDLLQNGDESDEASISTGAESSENPPVSVEESSVAVSQAQSGDETPPEESQGNQGSSSNPPAESTNTPSQGTTSQPSEASQGTTSKPAEPSQGTTSHSSETSQGTTSKPAESSQGTISQPSGGEFTGEIVASEKKYTYNGNDLMLLHVENKTALHLDITIKGRYLDKSGKVIKEESQTYRAFPSGWSNYFIFRPKMTFDSFDYTFEVKEFKSTTAADKLYAYNGDPLTKYAELTYSKNLTWMEDWYDSTAALCFNYALTNHHLSIPICIQFHVLILDEQGNIYLTDYELEDAVFGDGAFTGTSCTPVGGMDNGRFEAPCRLKIQPKDADRTIPSNVQGKLTAVFAIESVVDFNEVRNQLQ